MKFLILFIFNFIFIIGVCQKKDVRYIYLPEYAPQNKYNILYDMHFFYHDIKDTVYAITVIEKNIHNPIDWVFFLSRNYSTEKVSKITTSKIISLDNLKDTVKLHFAKTFSLYDYKTIFRNGDVYFIHDTWVRGMFNAEK